MILQVLPAVKSIRRDPQNKRNTWEIHSVAGKASLRVWPQQTQQPHLGLYSFPWGFMWKPYSFSLHKMEQWGTAVRAMGVLKNVPKTSGFW